MVQGEREREREREGDSFNKLGIDGSVKRCGLGFRGIKDFSTSLLGKQLWRLMQKDGSLLERLFNGRFYYRCQIYEAPLGSKPSYDWHNILNVEDVVVSSIRWRIWNGDKVLILKDNWVPTITGFKPMNY